MHEIRDNAYIFSIARGDHGRIIADRTNDGYYDSEYIFNRLQISDNEQNFLWACWEKDPRKTAVLSGERDGEKYAVFMNMLFSHDSSLCLALECPLGAGLLCIMTQGDAYGMLCPSDRIRELMVLSGSGEDSQCLERMSEGYLPCCIPRFIEPPYSDSTGRSVSEMAELANSASELAGSGCDCTIDGLSQLMLERSTLFLPGFFYSAVTVLAMAARRYSRTHRFSLLLEPVEGAAAARVCFEYSDIGELLFEKYLRNIAEHLGVSLSLTACDGVFTCEMIPYCFDVGLAGIKQDVSLLYKYGDHGE